MCRRSVFWKAVSSWIAPPNLKGRAGTQRAPAKSRSGLLDQHATTHLHMERMAEPVAVVPVNPRLTSRKGHRSRLLRADLHAHTMVHHTEAMGHILNGVQIGHNHRNLITLLHLELQHTELRCHRRHVHTHLLAIPDNLVIRLQCHAVFLGLRAGRGKVRIIPLPDFLRTDLITAHQDTVVRFSEGGAVMYQLHFLTGNIDQLIVLRVQRSYRQEAVFGELRQHHQPLAIRIAGFGQRRVVVARLVVNIQLLADVIHFLAIVVLDGIVNVPLGHLAVDKQRGVSIAATIEGGMQRSKTQLRLPNNRIAITNLVIEEVVQPVDGNDRHGRGQLAVGNEVLAIGGGIQAVRVLRHRNVTGNVGTLAPLNHGHLGITDGFEVAGFHGRFNTLNVEHHHPVTVVTHGAGQVYSFLGVVAGRGCIFAGEVRIGVIQVAVDNHLPSHFHGVCVYRRKHGVAVLKAVIAAIVRLWNHELRVTENILGARHLLKTQTMNRLNVRDMGDLVSLEDIQADTGNPAVGLVVDEQVLAIVVAIVHRDVRVVTVTVQVQFVSTQDLFTFVSDPPAGGRVHVEHRNPHQLAHGRNTQNTYFTLVTTAPETVVLIQLAWLDMRLVTGFTGSGGKRFAGHHGGAQAGCTSNASQGRGAHKAATAQTTFKNLRCFLAQIIFLAHSDNSVIGYGGFSFSWLFMCTAYRYCSFHLNHGDFLRVARCIVTTALAPTLDDQRRTLVVIEIGHLAIEAVVAFHVIDVPVRMDGLHFAFMVSEATWIPALLAAFEPVEHP